MPLLFKSICSKSPRFSFPERRGAMSDFISILEMLEDIQQRVEDVKDALGRLQVEGAGPGIGEVSGAPGPNVIPPTAPDVEIVGGEETNQFPDCCAVGNDVQYTCSGTLIAPNVVVTADHCRSVTRVFLKGNDISKPDDGEIIPVQQQFSHPEVDLKVLLLEHDSQVPPRHVAQGEEVAGAEVATLVGFGTINLAGTRGYGCKRTVEVPIYTLDCSGLGESKEYGCLPGWEIVAGHRGLQMDSCKGDSGGPLYIQNGDGYALLGATSRGRRDGWTICGDGGIYVRVDLCLDWIREVTGADIGGART
jgi:hypothetical protein